MAAENIAENIMKEFHDQMEKWRREGDDAQRIVTNSLQLIKERINAKIKEELDYTEGFLRSVQKKLSNERFVNNAPEQVVSAERKKEADALAKIETLKSSLASLE